jgi:hypothetical protein
MPEILYPGVYIEEIETNPRPIEGVPTDKLTMDSLAEQLREIIRQHAPEWSDFNSHDPGITLIQVLAWVSDTILYRISPSEEVRQAAIRAIASLSKFVSSCDRGTLVRPNFFLGQVLTAEDLQAEQEYHRQKQRIHNRTLHGFGIVSGLQVEAEDQHIYVSPGHAIDVNGEEIGLCTRVAIPLPKSSVEAFVSVRYFEVPCRPINSGLGEIKFSRVEEACILAVKDKAPDTGVALARVLLLDGKWVVDRDFNPSRVS